MVCRLEGGVGERVEGLYRGFGDHFVESWREGWRNIMVMVGGKEQALW